VKHDQITQAVGDIRNGTEADSNKDALGFLRQFIDANPDQLIGGETAEEWVISLWKVRNPAAKLKKSLDNFLAIFEPFVGPTVIALRKAIEPLTK